MLAFALAGCSGADPGEMSCKATFLYATSGPDVAVRAFEDFSDKRDYVVANNLATYLMLRGSKSGSKADFDQARKLLEAMDTSEVSTQLVARYVALLKFMASENGSDPGSFKLAEQCAPQVDFMALYSRTHLKVFGSEFQLPSSDMHRMLAQDESSCSSTGQDEPGTERSSLPQIPE